ncbi:MAG TPA: FecR domain-containing protein [Chitinophagaceae bacterium]|nr:FecR domain-containing protein [Chitinophagaceae bacterium]
MRRWLEDDANLAYYNQLKKIWDDSRQLASTTTVDENKGWENFRQKIHPAPVRRPGFGWMKIAASIIIVAAIGLVAYLTLNNRPKEIMVMAQQTVLTDTLPDGSFVTVNKGSSISYPSRFKGDTRQVVLKGEAFFNVTPNKKKPFVISVNDVTITVVGTSFNVRNINGNTEVVVETGIVKVTRAGKTIELNANEELHVNSNDSVLAKEKLGDHLYNYYRTKEFVCDDTPLWKVVEKINEAYDSHIVFGDPALREMLLTATFNNESLDQVLNVISETFNIKVTKEGDTIILQQ